MFRSLSVSFALLIVALALPLSAAEVKELRLIAMAQDSTRADNIGPVHLEVQGNAVIRNAEQLVAMSSKADAAKDQAVQKEMETELARLLQLEAIDWNRHMALAVRGEPGTKADKVRFDSLSVDGQVLTVTWKVIPRPPHAGPGTPIALILVERFDGDVRFSQPNP